MRPYTFALIALCASPVTLAAQQLVAPIRPLGPLQATSQVTFGPDIDVRDTPDGVLVYDRTGSTLVFLDSLLKRARVIVDTVGAGQLRHGRFNGRLLPYFGDSSLFVDPGAQALHVFDGQGRLARTMAAPTTLRLGALATGDRPGFDGKGRIIYRTGRGEAGGARAGAVSTGASAPDRTRDDSVLIVGTALTDGSVTTIATSHMPQPRSQLFLRTKPPEVRVGPIDPLSRIDQWTTLPDGRVAVVRGGDYRLEIFGGEGAPLALPRVPFEWQRLTEAGKEAYLDSVKAAQAARLAVERASPEETWGDGEIAEVARRSRLASTSLDVPGVEYFFVAAHELPDYRRAFGYGAVMADAESNIWVNVILPGLSGGRVYDVIDTLGKRIDRVQVPEGRTIVGFGPHSLYAIARTGKVMRLERYSLQGRSVR